MNAKSESDAPAWRGDWRGRIEKRAHANGQESLAKFFDAHPGLSYVELARLMAPGGDIAPVQLERLHTEITSHDRESRRDAILDSLARFLRGALKDGWGSGRYWQSSATAALASWTVMWGGTEDLRRMKVALFAKNPSVGWIPEPTNDPFLKQVFEQALPEGFR